MLVHFARAERRNVLVHVASPVLGIGVVVAILWGMNPSALVLGVIWLITGLAWWRFHIVRLGLVPSDRGLDPFAQA